MLAAFGIDEGWPILLNGDHVLSVVESIGEGGPFCWVTLIGDKRYRVAGTAAEILAAFQPPVLAEVPPPKEVDQVAIIQRSEEGE